MCVSKKFSFLLMFPLAKISRRFLSSPHQVEGNYSFIFPKQQFFRKFFSPLCRKGGGKETMKVPIGSSVNRFRYCKFKILPNSFLSFCFCFSVYYENKLRLQIYFVLFIKLITSLSLARYIINEKDINFVHFASTLYFLKCIF